MYTQDDYNDEECQHLEREVARGAHTCLSCFMVLSVDMYNEAAAGNQWGGAAGRTMQGKNITAKAMLQDIAVPLSDLNLVIPTASPVVVKSEPPVQKSKALASTKKQDKVKVPVSKTVVAPKNSKPRKPVSTTTRPSMTRKTRSPAPQESIPVAPSTPEISESLPKPSSEPLVKEDDLIALPAGVVLCQEVHIEASRLFQLVCGSLKKTLRQSKMREILLFASIIIAHEKVGLDHGITESYAKIFNLKDPEITKGLSEFNSNCPRSELLAIQALSVPNEVKNLLLKYFDGEELQDHVHCVIDIWKLVKDSIHSKYKAGRLRTSHGLVHYYRCFIAGSTVEVVSPNPSLCTIDSIREVSIEIDGVMNTKLFL